MMRKIFASLLVVLLALPAKAQDCSDTVSFSVQYKIVKYAVSYCQGADFTPVKAAICKATSATTPDTATVTVILRESQVLQILGILANVPEHIGAEPNAVLKAALLAKLTGRPCLTDGVTKFLAASAESLAQREAMGGAELDEMRSMYELN